MFKFFKKYLFAFLVPLAAGGIWFYVGYTKSYLEIRCSTTLLNDFISDDSNMTGFTFAVDSIPYDSIWITTFNLSNSGGQDISVKDFENGGLDIKSKSPMQIINLTKVQGSRNLSSKIINNTDYISLNPTTFKKGEMISFNVLSKSEISELRVENNIFDLDEIIVFDKRENIKSKRDEWLRKLLFHISIFISIFIAFDLPSRKELDINDKKISVLRYRNWEINIISLVLLLYVIYTFITLFSNPLFKDNLMLNTTALLGLFTSVVFMYFHPKK